MKIYDKAVWHIDAGEDKDEVVARLLCVFKYLEKHEMLTDEGAEILEIGIDASISLNEYLVNRAGQEFLEKNYDSLMQLSLPEIQIRLKD